MSELEVEFRFEDWQLGGHRLCRADLRLTLACEGKLVALFIGRNFPAHLEEVKWRRRDSSYDPTASWLTLNTEGWVKIADELHVEPLRGVLWAETMYGLTSAAAMAASRAVIEAWSDMSVNVLGDPRLEQAMRDCSFTYPIPSNVGIL